MDKIIKNTVVGLVLAGGLSAANAHIESRVETSGTEVVALLDYLNVLDKDAAAREAHAKDPKSAMTRHGLTLEEQRAVLTGDEKKVATLIGIHKDSGTILKVDVTHDAY